MQEFRPVQRAFVSQALRCFINGQDSTYHLNNTSDDNEPDDNPGDAFHGIIIEVIMDGIQLFM